MEMPQMTGKRSFAMETAVKTRREPTPMNGVDTPNLFATINVVKGAPELARFRFQATNKWLSGTHSRTVIDSFSGAGAEHTHKADFIYDADHPAVLVGQDNAPLPVEFLLHALGSCITAGIASVAAARGVKLTSVESTIDGDVNLLGVLGLAKDVRNGYEKIRVAFTIAGDAPPETLKAIVEQSRARSAVYDVLTNGVPVELSIRTK
jgi:uncharacterized OsmC-like protein